MKICIAGKNNIAVDCLLYSLKFYDKKDICVVLNKTDKLKNSWQKSLGFYAQNLGISILSLSDVMNIGDIVFFSIEFDFIIRPSNFKSNKLFNIHFSKLPEYKGMFTSIMPILHGKTHSGVTLHAIDQGIDTGDIIDQVCFEIKGLTSRKLYEKFLFFGTELFKKNFKKICSNSYERFQQPSLNSSYFSRKTINFNDIEIICNQTANQISIFVNAFNFRVYQTAKFNGRPILKTQILNTKSILKPGTIIKDDFYSVIVATIDFDIKLFYDFYDIFLKCCELDLILDAKNIINYIDDVNETNANGWSPIIVAAYFGSSNILKLLLSMGVNINSTNLNYTTLLMYACSNFDNHKNIVIIEYLLNMGANLNLKDIHGLTIFDYCSNIELINILNKYR